MTETALEFIGKDPLLNADLLDCIRAGCDEILFASPKGVLLYSTACRAFEMSTEDPETASSMLNLVGKAVIFVAHQEFYIREIREKFGLKPELVCRQAAYLSGTPLPESPDMPEICRLDGSFLPFLREHYSYPMDDGYLLGRLHVGAMYGAFRDGKQMGFIGRHEEGSIGMLEVLPQYRRKGIARSMETFLANKILAEGRTPFGQLMVDNASSLALQKNLGFVISEKNLFWLM